MIAAKELVYSSHGTVARSTSPIRGIKVGLRQLLCDRIEHYTVTTDRRERRIRLKLGEYMVVTVEAVKADQNPLGLGSNAANVVYDCRCGT